MSSFRKYGGLNYAAANNIVRNNINTTDNKSISTGVGESNSKIVYYSHIDLCGNSLLNVGSIYFMNGTSQTSAYVSGSCGPSGSNISTDGSFNTLLGSNTSISGNYSTAIGYNSTAIGDNQIVIGTVAETTTIPGDLIVAKTITGTLAIPSDYRIKERIHPITQDINKLNPVEYYNTFLRKQDYGFIAHELQEIFPSLVSGTKDGAEVQAINYSSLIAVLVKEVQDLKARVALLEKN